MMEPTDEHDDDGCVEMMALGYEVENDDGNANNETNNIDDDDDDYGDDEEVEEMESLLGRSNQQTKQSDNTERLDNYSKRRHGCRIGIGKMLLLIIGFVVIIILWISPKTQADTTTDTHDQIPKVLKNDHPSEKSNPNEFGAVIDSSFNSFNSLDDDAIQVVSNLDEERDSQQNKEIPGKDEKDGVNSKSTSNSNFQKNKMGNIAILHVGPVKTGTTSIQTAMSIMEKKNVLTKDNYYSPYREWPSMSNRGFSNCFLTPETFSENPNMKHSECIQQSVESAISIATNGQHNFLLSCERLSMSTVDSSKLIEFLTTHWKNVTIVVYYRRVFQWLLSVHNQRNKEEDLGKASKEHNVKSDILDHYFTQMNNHSNTKSPPEIVQSFLQGQDYTEIDWEYRFQRRQQRQQRQQQLLLLQEGNKENKLENFTVPFLWFRPPAPDFLEYAQYRNITHRHTPQVVDRYRQALLVGKHYHSDRHQVQVVNMHASTGLEMEFFCDVIPHANHTCEAYINYQQKQVDGKGLQRRNIAHTFTYQDLTFAASQLELVYILNGPQLDWLSFVLQETHQLQLELFQNDIDNGNKWELPMICAKPTVLDDILQESLEAEQTLLPDWYDNPLGKDQLLLEFEEYKSDKKFCSVDVEATWNNPWWRWLLVDQISLTSRKDWQKSSLQSSPKGVCMIRAVVDNNNNNSNNSSNSNNSRNDSSDCQQLKMASHGDKSENVGIWVPLVSSSRNKKTCEKFVESFIDVCGEASVDSQYLTMR